MSLLQDEEYVLRRFLIYQLRTSYLTFIKDGVGERLINIDVPSILGNPVVRSMNNGAGSDIQRTYSPPIPTGQAVAAEYFSAPPKSAGLLRDGDGPAMGKGSAETVGPGPQRRRRRRREQREDDSSDLSDDSEDELTQTAVQQIKFDKMPVRTRAGSSPLGGGNPPIRSTQGASGPTKPIPEGQTDTQGEATASQNPVKQRPRRDTTTSSDMSSDNEATPSHFNPEHGKFAKVPKSLTFQDTVNPDDERSDQEEGPLTVKEHQRNPPEDVASGSSLSSELAETADSESLLDLDNGALGTSSLGDLVPPGMTHAPPASPRKLRTQQPNTLQALPPPRPISTILPVSALGQAIRARKEKPKNPQEMFAKFSGKGALDPLQLRIYYPFAKERNTTLDFSILKNFQDSETGAFEKVTVAEAIGFCLWRYTEEKFEPPIPREKLDVNWWSLRVIDEGEIDDDFPPLQRTKGLTEYTRKPTGPRRGRARSIGPSEYAVVEVSELEYGRNQAQTPEYTKLLHAFEAPEEGSQSPRGESAVSDELGNLNTTIPKPFAFGARKGSMGLDRPDLPTNFSTPRTGPIKVLKIHFTNHEALYQTASFEVTTDTYLGEVLELACKRWHLDKTWYFLRVTGTDTIAPSDRTIETMGTHKDLDLMSRRFAHAGAVLGLAGSPSSSSPNAPLNMTAPVTAPAKKGKKTTFISGPGGSGGVGGGAGSSSTPHPLSQQQDLWGLSSNYKRYNVTRKQPMSFAPSHTRTLLMDGEYLHILPAETGRGRFDTSAKTQTFPFSMIVGCKVSRRHPKSFRVVVFRDRETKRYDFEAATASEAEEIVIEIRKGMEPFSVSML